MRNGAKKTTFLWTQGKGNGNQHRPTLRHLTSEDRKRYEKEMQRNRSQIELQAILGHRGYRGRARVRLIDSMMQFESVCVADADILYSGLESLSDAISVYYINLESLRLAHFCPEIIMLRNLHCT